MILWTVTLWTLVPLFIKIFGYNGISIAFFIMSLTFVLVYMQARRFVSFSLLEFIKENVIATMAMTLYLAIVRLLTVNTSPYFYVFLSVVGGGGIYFLVLYRLKGKTLYTEFLDLLKMQK